MIAPHPSQLLAFVQRAKIIRTRDLKALGIPRMTVSRLCEQGQLERLARGVYGLPKAPISPHHTLAIAACAVPKGIVCLLSALRYYDIGTQIPSVIWLSIPRSSAMPVCDYPPLHCVRVSEPAYSDGRTTHLIDGVSVAMTTPAKTVADCFKFRRHIGLDVAIEALRETLKVRLATFDTIWTHAERCRVGRIIRPYLEAMA